MRKRRGLILMVVGIVLAAAAGFMVLGVARQAAQQAARPAVVQPEPLKKVYVVVAEKDLPENVAISAQDISTKEFPADFAPAGAVAAPEYAVGKYTTARVFKGQILVAPQLAESRKTSQLSAKVPDGKVAMAVTLNDPLNNLGALRAGDRVDVLLSLDMNKAQSKQQGDGQAAQGEAPQEQLSTQITMQAVEILNIGLPAGDATTTTENTQNRPSVQTAQQAAKTITFLLNPQDAVTLKFIKDSGGSIDLVVRSPEDKKVFQTTAVTIDTIYKQYKFRFAEPVK